MTALEPETIYRNFLRGQLTDYNSANRSGKEWVYDDWPRDDLIKASFPRVTVIKVEENGPMIGIQDDTTWDTILLQVDVLVHRDTGVVTIAHTGEAVGVILNTPRLSFDQLPQIVSDVLHDAVSFGTVTSVVNDDDFTSPGSLATDEVEWSISTGNLNFSTQDLSDHSGEAITVDYTEELEGEVLAKRVGRDVVISTRTQWRTDTLLNDMIIPTKVSGPRVVEFGKPEGWHRVMIEYQWKRFNTGEQL